MNTRWPCMLLLGSVLLVCGTLRGGQNPTKQNNDEVFSGHIEAVESVELKARVTGYLDKIDFKGGTMVKRGDMLFEIDPRPYKVQLDKAVADVQFAEARQKRLSTSFERAKTLVAKGGISEGELNQIIGDKEEGDASLNSAKARLDSAKLYLGLTKITAPISGKISRPVISPGNLVRADETPLAMIISTDPVHVAFDIDERTLLRLARTKRDEKDAGILVQIGLADETGFPRTGTVDSVETKIDPKTGTIRFRALVPNPDGVLMPGMSARVRLAAGAQPDKKDKDK